MEAQVQTHNSPCGVCCGQSDTKSDFLSEQFGITDFKISPIMTWYNRLFVMIGQKVSSSYTYIKKEIYQGNIAYMCNISNYIYC